MGGALDWDTSMADLDAYLNEELEKRVGLIIEAFRRIGEECINVARVKVKALPRDYVDRTGNLRSSIGYAILDDGELVGVPKVVRVTKGGKDGAPIARAYLRELQSEYKEGLVLVVVAGMDYAAYVQAKGYDVLSSAELTMQALIERMVAHFEEAGML